MPGSVPFPSGLEHSESRYRMLLAKFSKKLPLWAANVSRYIASKSTETCESQEHLKRPLLTLGLSVMLGLNTWYLAKNDWDDASLVLWVSLG